MFGESKLLFKLWLKDPRKIGAVAASGPDLARAMARLVPTEATGPVIELGGGTGPVTKALLDSGIAPERLVVLERDETLHGLLARRYPGVRVVLGDAAKLTEELRPLGIAHASAVVSSLPLLNMSKPVQQAIAEESFALLDPGAPFIQFTYGLFSPLPRRALELEGSVRKRVLTNLPPASVWLYRKRAGARRNGAAA